MWTMLVAVDKSWIVSCWVSKTISTTCNVFTYSWSAGLKSVIFVMDANPLLNSLNEAVSVHQHQTPAEFQGWKSSPFINCHTTKFSAWQCFQYHFQCT
jgi:hypothetical protein